MRKNVEVISLIYKSVDYLNLITNELKSNKCVVDGWDVGIRLVLNDATEEVIEAVKDLDIPYTIYNDKNPSEYYLNRVYRCWNFAGQSSDYDNICFVNSDMVFSEDWLKNLLEFHDGMNIPCSRLVESGKMQSGTHGVSNNLGKHPHEIQFGKWDAYVKSISRHSAHLGGLYMPCIFEKTRFVESGMYPEGNVWVGNRYQSGDDYFFKALTKNYGMKHVTIFDSLVYHIQEGEMDS